MATTTKSLQVNEDNHPISCNFTPSSSALTKKSALIPDMNTLRYSTDIYRAIDIEVKFKGCFESETGWYMLVTSVAEHMVEDVYEVLEEHAIRNVVQFAYEQRMESVIVRLSPGASHENAGWSLSDQITNKVKNIPGHSLSSSLPIEAPHFMFPVGGANRAIQVTTHMIGGEVRTGGHLLWSRGDALEVCSAFDVMIGAGYRTREGEQGWLSL